MVPQGLGVIESHDGPCRLCRHSMPGRWPKTFGSTADKGGGRAFGNKHTGKAGELRYGVGVPGIWQHSMPGKRPGHWTAEQAKEAGEASPGIARRRRGIAGGMRGRGCPAGHFLHCRHPAMTQVRRLRLTPPASPSRPSVLSVCPACRAFRALRVSALAPTPDATRLPFQRLPCSLCARLAGPSVLSVFLP